MSAAPTLAALAAQLVMLALIALCASTALAGAKVCGLWDLPWRWVAAPLTAVGVAVVLPVVASLAVWVGIGLIVVLAVAPLFQRGH